MTTLAKKGRGRRAAAAVACFDRREKTRTAAAAALLPSTSTKNAGHSELAQQARNLEQTILDSKNSTPNFFITFSSSGNLFFGGWGGGGGVGHFFSLSFSKNSFIFAAVNIKYVKLWHYQ